MEKTYSKPVMVFNQQLMQEIWLIPGHCKCLAIGFEPFPTLGFEPATLRGRYPWFVSLLWWRSLVTFNQHQVESWCIISMITHGFGYDLVMIIDLITTKSRFLMVLVIILSIIICSLLLHYHVSSSTIYWHLLSLLYISPPNMKPAFETLLGGYDAPRAWAEAFRLGSRTIGHWGAPLLRVVNSFLVVIFMIKLY